VVLAVRRKILQPVVRRFHVACSGPLLFRFAAAERADEFAFLFVLVHVARAVSVADLDIAVRVMLWDVVKLSGKTITLKSGIGRRKL